MSFDHIYIKEERDLEEEHSYGVHSDKLLYFKNSFLKNENCENILHESGKKSRLNVKQEKENEDIDIIIEDSNFIKFGIPEKEKLLHENCANGDTKIEEDSSYEDVKIIEEACYGRITSSLALDENNLAFDDSLSYSRGIKAISSNKNSNYSIPVTLNPVIKSEKPYKCNSCDYSSVYKGDLKRHTRCHTGEKPFHCSSCDYSTARKSDLNLHNRIHTGEKPFKCTYCEYCVARKSDLNRHMKRHTGIKPFKCKDCDYSSSERSHLKIHITTHTGEKPFECTFCDYRAVRNIDVKRHIRRHTGEKPFQCSDCNYRAAQKSQIKLHVKTCRRLCKI